LLLQIATAEADSRTTVEKICIDFYRYSEHAIIEGKNDKNERVLSCLKWRDKAGTIDSPTLNGASMAVESKKQATKDFQSLWRSLFGGCLFY